MFRREPPRWESINQKGIELVEQGQYGDALIQFEEALSIHPRSAQIHDNLGVTHAYLEQFLSALYHHIKAMEIDPSNPAPYYNLGRLIHYQGDLIAHQAYEKTLQLNQDYPDVHYQLGMLYAEQEEYEKAIALLRRSIQIDPNHAEDYNGLGFAYMMLGDEKKARQYWLNAISLDIGNYYAHLSLSALYAIHNKFDRSISHLAKAIKANPKRAKEDAHEMEQFDYIRSHPKFQKLFQEIEPPAEEKE